MGLFDFCINKRFNKNFKKNEKIEKSKIPKTFG